MVRQKQICIIGAASRGLPLGAPFPSADTRSPSSSAPATSAACGSPHAPIPTCRRKARRTSIATPTRRCRTRIPNGRRDRRSMPICATMRGSRPRPRRAFQHDGGQDGPPHRWQTGLDARSARAGMATSAARTSTSSPSAPDSSTSRRPSIIAARRRSRQRAANPALVAIQRRGIGEGTQSGRARRLEVGHRHRGQRGQLGRQRSHDSSTANRCGEFPISSAA